MKSYYKYIMYFLQLLLVAICFIWLYNKVDWKETIRYCLSVSLFALVLVVLQRISPYLMLGLRLHFFFPKELSFMNGVRASVFCIGTNSLIPARMGEFVKIFYLKSKTVLSYPQLFSACFIERLCDVCLLLFLTLIFAGPFINAQIVSILCIIACFAWICLFLLIKKGKLTLSFLPKCLVEVAQQFNASIKENLQSHKLMKVLSASIGIWCLNYTHIYLLANYLLELNLTGFQVGMLCVTVFFSSALLLSPGGVGAMEAGVVLVLGSMGIEPNKAASLAVFARLLYSLPPILMSAIFLLESRHMSFTSLTQSLGEIFSMHKLNKISIK